MTENRWVSDLHWRREGRQTRSEKTQTALLDATESLLLEKGTEATAVADIADRAGCSIGSLYHHFKDKKAIYYAVFDRMTREFQAVLSDAVDPARWEGASIEDLLEGFAVFSLQATRERPEFKAAAMLVANDYPELRAHYAELQTRALEGLRQLLLARKDAIGHPDPATATAFTIDQLNALMQARLNDAQTPTQLTRGDEDVFIREAVCAASAYLQLKTTHD